MDRLRAMGIPRQKAGMANVCHASPSRLVAIQRSLAAQLVPFVYAATSATYPRESGSSDTSRCQTTEFGMDSATGCAADQSAWSTRWVVSGVASRITTVLDFALQPSASARTY